MRLQSAEIGFGKLGDYKRIVSTTDNSNKVDYYRAQGSLTSKHFYLGGRSCGHYVPVVLFEEVSLRWHERHPFLIQRGEGGFAVFGKLVGDALVLLRYALSLPRMPQKESGMVLRIC